MLPEDILLHIISLLPRHDMFPCSLVCKDFERVVKTIVGSSFVTPIATAVLNAKRLMWVLSLGPGKPPVLKFPSWTARLPEYIVAFGSLENYMTSALSAEIRSMIRPAMFISAARNGNVANLAWGHDCGLLEEFLTHEKDNHNHLVNAAVDGGHLSVVKYLRTGNENGKHWVPYPWDSNQVLRRAARAGRVDVLRWSIDHGCSVKPMRWSPCHPIALAAKHGFLDCVKFLLPQSDAVGIVAKVARFGAHGGHRKIVEWAFTVDRNACLQEKCKIISTALRKGLSDFAIWLCDYTCLQWTDLNVDVLVDAIRNECVSFLNKFAPLANGPELMVVACENYPRHGLKIIRILSNCDTTIQVEAFAAAACVGDVELMDFLVTTSDSIPMDTRIVEAALKNNNDATLRWAIHKGCPWDHTHVTSYLKRMVCLGHIDKLKFFADFGYLADPSLATEAAEENQLQILRWLYKQGCQFPEDICNSAADYGQLDALKFLRFIGFPVGASTFVHAARNGELSVIQWLHDTGVEFDESATYTAYNHREYEAFRLLIAMGCPYDTSLMALD